MGWEEKLSWAILDAYWTQLMWKINFSKDILEPIL
jgi:hypothetical protein